MCSTGLAQALSNGALIVVAQNAAQVVLQGSEATASREDWVNGGR